MQLRLRCNGIAALLVPLLAFSPAHAQQEAAKRESAQRREASSITARHPAWLYRDGFSASELIGTPVRDDWGRRVGDVEDIIADRAGTIEKVVAEVGGFLEFADQHVGVPWRDVQVGPDLRWVQVPLQEVESDTYSLGGGIPRGEDIAIANTAWRVSDLIGEYASIEDEERPLLVTDVVFTREGEVRAVVVKRGGDYVGPGWDHVHPYAGYRRGRYAYDQSQSRDSLRFEYVQFGHLSRFAGSGRNALAQ